MKGVKEGRTRFSLRNDTGAKYKFLTNMIKEIMSKNSQPVELAQHRNTNLTFGRSRSRLAQVTEKGKTKMITKIAPIQRMFTHDDDARTKDDSGESTNTEKYIRENTKGLDVISSGSPSDPPSGVTAPQALSGISPN